MKKKIDVVGIMLVILVVAAIVVALSLVVMVLWNWIMPGIILCDKIGFMQSVGLIALASLLTMDKSKLFSWFYE